MQQLGWICRSHIARSLATVGVCVAAVAAVGTAAAARADAAPGCVTWTAGAVRDFWDVSSNWSTNTVPGPGDDVCINVEGANPVINSSVKINALQLGAKSLLDINAPGGLTAVEAVTDFGGIYEVNGSLTSPSIDIEDGVIYSSGSGISTLNSPKLQLLGSGTLAALQGTLALSSDPMNLTAGTLSGGRYATAHTGAIKFQSNISVLDAVLDAHGPGVHFLNSLGGDGLRALSKITNGGRLIVGDTASVTTVRSLDVLGSVELQDDAATLTVSGPITDEGLFTFGSTNGLVQTPTFTVTKSGMVDGSVVIRGDVVNGGQVRTGSTLVRVGTPLHITGNYTQTSAGLLMPRLTSDGLIPFPSGTPNPPVLAPLMVDGTASLNGTLSFPAPGPKGSTYSVVTANSRQGTFTSRTFGTPVTYTATAAIAKVAPDIAAPSAVTHGKLAQVRGVTFSPSVKVVFYLDKVAGAGIGSATTSSMGSFTVNLRIPAGAKRTTHTLIAVAKASGQRASQTLTIH
jgi:hypothetical protein